MGDRRLIDLADPDGGHDPDPSHNRLTMSDGLSGELHLEADLVGEGAALVRAALLAELERRYRFHRELNAADEGHQFPGRGQMLAEALIESLRRGVSSSPGAAAPVTDVTLVIHAGAPLGATTPDGVRISDGTRRRLLCDAALHALVVDSLGVPLGLGRLVRFATKEQRGASVVRDGGCVHPGCDAPPSWTQLHHIHEVRLGGPTDVTNLVSLCPAHHDLIHSKGWRIEDDGLGGFVITSPRGVRLRSQRNRRPRDAPPPRN